MEQLTAKLALQEKENARLVELVQEAKASFSEQSLGKSLEQAIAALNENVGQKLDSSQLKAAVDK